MKVFLNDLHINIKNLEPKSWHRNRNYFYRVQKKWEKRFGTKMLIPDGEVIKDEMHHVIFCNSVTFAELKGKLRGSP